MVIKDGFVFREDGAFHKGDLYVEDGKIVAQEDVRDRAVLDAQGLYVIPGLVDVHSHGAVGHDFSDADSEGLRQILRYEYACGVTSYCPTSMSLPRKKLLDVFGSVRAVGAVDGKRGMAHIAGIHMEGPFLADRKCGAHDRESLLAPDVSFFRACNAACGGQARLVTLAPELPGAMEFIREVCGEVTVSLGHTDADYQVSAAAIKAGAHHVTHLYNAMRPFAHREPGVIGAAMDAAQCMVELICDGVHVHESAVRAAFALFPGRVVLVSDSMRATGLSDGCYELGGQQVQVKGRYAALPDGTIAGSVTNLYDCMRMAVSFGIPLEDAVTAASAAPAKSIGIYGSVGSLAVGKRADILLVDGQMDLVRNCSGITFK